MTTTMKERPILFSAPMVRAILEDRKTVTRRVVKSKFPLADVITGKGDQRGAVWYGARQVPAKDPGDIVAFRCRYGQPGDRLWVRETTGLQVRRDGCGGTGEFRVYRASHPDAVREITASGNATPIKWVPSIHMPRRASRITLEVTGVRVERLQDITHEQAIAEGVHVVPIGSGYLDRYSAAPVAWSDVVEGLADAYEDARLAFRDLWDGINAARGFGWAANPMVWVVEFKRIEATA